MAIDPRHARAALFTAVVCGLSASLAAQIAELKFRATREALMLQTITLAVEQGADVNAVNTDGRTALDAARALKFERVAAFLVEHGARAGTTKR